MFLNGQNFIVEIHITSIANIPIRNSKENVNCPKIRIGAIKSFIMPK